RGLLELRRRLPSAPPKDDVQVYGAPPVMTTALPSVHPDLARHGGRETVTGDPPGSAVAVLLGPGTALFPLVDPPGDVRRRQGGRHEDADQDEIQPEREGKADQRADRDSPHDHEAPAQCTHNTLRRCSRTGSRRPVPAHASRPG